MKIGDLSAGIQFDEVSSDHTVEDPIAEMGESSSSFTGTQIGVKIPVGRKLQRR